MLGQLLPQKILREGHLSHCYPLSNGWPIELIPSELLAWMVDYRFVMNW